MNPFDLIGKTALVTGSTSGIGQAIADTLARAGAAVIRHGHAVGSEPDAIIQDLLLPDAPSALLEEAFQRTAALDILVCNAGGFFDTGYLDMTPEAFDRTLSLNVRQAYFLIQGFARRLIEAGRPGAVVIVSSTNGFHAEEASTAYDISKGALVMMTRTLALALAPHQIRVNGIAPGLIRTPLTSPWLDANSALKEHYENKILAGRVGVPQDCADPCVFLCSDAARYIHGQTLVIDGGLTVGQIGKFVP